MKSVRILLSVAALSAAAVGLTVTPASAGQTKSDVCHGGDDGIELISIADPAIDSHIAHGDAQPGDVLDDGGILQDDCSIEYATMEGFCGSLGGVYSQPSLDRYECQLPAGVEWGGEFPLGPTWGMICLAETGWSQVTSSYSFSYDEAGTLIGSLLRCDFSE